MNTHRARKFRQFENGLDPLLISTSVSPQLINTLLTILFFLMLLMLENGIGSDVSNVIISDASWWILSNLSLYVCICIHIICIYIYKCETFISLQAHIIYIYIHVYILLHHNHFTESPKSRKIPNILKEWTCIVLVNFFIKKCILRRSQRVPL